MCYLVGVDEVEEIKSRWSEPLNTNDEFLDEYAPPWDNPATENPPLDWDEYRIQMDNWYFSIYGGGLWDFEEAAKIPPLRYHLTKQP